MGNIVLVVILVLIGVISIFNLTIGKKNRQKANAHNRDVFGALRDKAVDEFGQAKFDKMKKIPYMSDSSNGYILCFDKESDVMAMITYEDVFKMKYSSKKSFEAIIDGDDRYFNSLVCSISAPELEQAVEIRLAGSRHRRNGFMGKAILQDAEEMRTIITTGKIPSGKED